MTINLKVGGLSHAGWKKASVSRGIESPAGGFELTVSDRWPGQDVPVSILPGDTCQVLVNRTPVITGYVDEVSPNYSAGQHEITFKGRSKTADLVDCSVVHKGQFRGMTLDKIASELASPFGVKVVSRVDVGLPINEDINQGETIWDALEPLGRMRSVLLCDDESGNLVLTRAGTAKSSGAIIKTTGNETNVIDGRATFSMQERFSSYVVKGQSAGTDTAYGDAAAANEGKATDGNVTRHRPLVIIAENQASSGYCADRAKWERAVRAGKAVRLEYTVRGWTQDGVNIWQPNILVPVRDDFLHVSGTFLISDVSWDISDSGETTRLVCVPPEAYETMPYLPDASKAAAFWQKQPVAQAESK